MQHRRRVGSVAIAIVAMLLGAGALSMPVARADPPQICGGILQIVCPEGYVCVKKDPSCLDCTGVCKRQHRP